MALAISHFASEAFVQRAVGGTHTGAIVHALGQRWPVLVDREASGILAPLIPAPGELVMPWHTDDPEDAEPERPRGVVR